MLGKRPQFSHTYNKSIDPGANGKSIGFCSTTKLLRFQCIVWFKFYIFHTDFFSNQSIFNQTRSNPELKILPLSVEKHMLKYLLQKDPKFVLFGCTFSWLSFHRWIFVNIAEADTRSFPSGEFTGSRCCKPTLHTAGLISARDHTSEYFINKNIKKSAPAAAQHSSSVNARSRNYTVARRLQAPDRVVPRPRRCWSPFTGLFIRSAGQGHGHWAATWSTAPDICMSEDFGGKRLKHSHGTGLKQASAERNLASS